MISSGIKRGLAASAVSALAIAGVPLLATSASAIPLSSAVNAAGSVYLATPATASASTKADGTDSTIHLEAVGGNGVTSVKFEYSLGGAYTAISTVTRNDNGAFAYEWTPTGLDGASLTVRATGLAADGTTVTSQVTKALAISSTANSTNVTAGTAIGVFQKPDYDGAGADTAANNVIVNGTSSQPASAPTLAYWDEDTDGVTAGNQPGFAGSATATSTTAAGATTGTWAGVLDITGYVFGTGDELLVSATDVTDDSESFNLYKQTITTVDAAADRTQVPTGQTATVTVTVKDQNGNPIAGAEVRNSGGALVGQTDRKGQVTTTQGASSTSYYANATDSDAYEPELGDKQSSAVTVTQYAPAPTALSATSIDGAAFDLDEYNPAADISVQIKDQNGNNISESGRTVRYFWTETPFDGSPASQRVPAGTATSTAVTVNGKAIIPLPTVTDPDGTYVLNVALDADGLGNGAVAGANVLTVKAGDSSIKFDQGSPEQAVAGTSEVVSGKLVLADGTGLAGRSVQVAYAGGTNAGIVQADGSTLGASRTVTTGADGSFQVTVKDPAETPTQPTESGTVTATTQAGTSDSDNPAETASTQVQFVGSVTPGIVDVVDTSSGDTPGEIDNVTVHVTTGDLDPVTPGNQTSPLSNASVTLTLDHGYFTDGTPAATPVVGADAGAFKVIGTNAGQSLTVQTDASGDVTVETAIGRDAGFDDDGLVTAKVTATAGTATDNDGHTWDSSNPLNGGEVKLVETPADRQNGPTSPSSTNNAPMYDVFVTDQFGNLVGGETVNLSVDDPDADLFGSSTSDFDSRGDFGVESSREGIVTVTGDWFTDTYKYTSTAGATAFGTETVHGSTDVEFYAVDFSASTFTITSDPEGEVPVGTAVTETVLVVDQEGNPVPGLDVQFIRQGPGSGTGDANYITSTNSNGQAFYSFTGTKAGVARISAVIDNDDQVKTITDEVAFTAAPKQNIGLKVKGHSSGKNDVIDANANQNGAGLTAVLFKNGKRVKSHALDGSGDFSFTVKDTNGSKKTTYKVVVAPTAATNGDSKTIHTK